MSSYSPVTKKIPKKIYRAIHSYLPIVCVDLIISDGKGKFLLVRRKNEPEKGKWWFPGGRIMKNEKLKEAVARKLNEETGLKPKKIHSLGFYEYFSKTGYFPGTNAHTVAFPFFASVSWKDVKLDWQSSEWKWFDKVNAKWHPYLKLFLRKSGFR